MQMLEEFRHFAVVGNAVDTASSLARLLGKIVTSLVNDVTIPCTVWFVR